MEPNPMKTAGRRARRDRRFNVNMDADSAGVPACGRCGITTPETLVAGRRPFLEAHHVGGRANDAGLTVPVCRNCHAVLTEGQRAAGVSLVTPPTLLHQIAAALTSVFAFLHDFAERGMAWTEALSRLIGDLDSIFPAWRELPSARALGVSP